MSRKLLVKELREGNIVKYSSKYSNKTNFKLTAQDIAKLTKENSCEGYSLTEETLLKCGFTPNNKIEPTAYYKSLPLGKATELCIEVFGGLPYETVIVQENSEILRGGGRFSYMRNIKYLHELQNLYYAISGEELVINLQTNK